MSSLDKVKEQENQINNTLEIPYPSSDKNKMFKSLKPKTSQASKKILEDESNSQAQENKLSDNQAKYPSQMVLNKSENIMVGNTRSFSDALITNSASQFGQTENHNESLDKGSCSNIEDVLVSDTNLLKKKKERRTKDENYQRNYVCGCGKSYLSYAALYTHAKTKHNGTFPNGTTTLHKKKQGRPKKEEWCQEKLNCEFKKIYQFNKELIEYLEMIPNAKILRSQVPVNVIECFPFEIFAKKEIYETLFFKLEKMKKEFVSNYGVNYLSQIDPIILEINNAKSLNCNEVFSLFLIYISRFVTVPFYIELVFFIVSYQQMMNTKGWSKINETNENDVSDNSLDFCEEQSAEFVPDFANYFILDYFGEALEPGIILKENFELKFFGLDSIKLLRIILIIQHFCLWLFNNKFTKAKIDIFKE